MSAPQDVLRRMIAQATREPNGATPQDRYSEIHRIDDALLDLEQLAPVLAQHLAEALDLLGEHTVDYMEGLNEDQLDALEGKRRDLLASVERDLAHLERAALGYCECGHHFGVHNQLRRCEATVYTDAPLGGGNAYPCPCRAFTESPA